MMQGESGCKKAGRRPKPSSGRFRRASPAGPGGAGAACGPHPGPFAGWERVRAGSFSRSMGEGAEKLQKGQRSRGNPYGISPAG